MGLFKNSHFPPVNGLLPRVKVREYYQLQVPSTSMLTMPNFGLMKFEDNHGDLERALGASVEAFMNPTNKALVIGIIGKYLQGYIQKMELSLNEEATEFLARFIGIGCGMALVESASGLMIEGKVHPSIQNVFTRAIINLSDKQREAFQSVENYEHVIEKAIEIGYVGSRLNGSLEISELLAQIRPLR